MTIILYLRIGHLTKKVLLVFAYSFLTLSMLTGYIRKQFGNSLRMQWVNSLIFHMKPGFYLGYSLITIITKGSKCRLLATGQGIKLYLLFTASNEYLRMPPSHRLSSTLNIKFKTLFINKCSLYQTQTNSRTSPLYIYIGAHEMLLWRVFHSLKIMYFLIDMDDILLSCHDSTWKLWQLFDLWWIINNCPLCECYTKQVT